MKLINEKIETKIVEYIDTKLTKCIMHNTRYGAEIYKNWCKECPFYNDKLGTHVYNEYETEVEIAIIGCESDTFYDNYFIYSWLCPNCGEVVEYKSDFYIPEPYIYNNIVCKHCDSHFAIISIKNKKVTFAVTLPK